MAELTPNLQPKGESCGSCRFAGTHVHAGTEPRDRALVRCKRYPPQRLGNQPPLHSGTLVSQQRDTVWPVLTWDDWCGEWQARVTTARPRRSPAK